MSHNSNGAVHPDELLTLRQQIADLQQERARDQQELDALRAERDYFRMIADGTYHWEYWLAPNGTLRYVSPACERITGYRPDEFQADPGLLERIIHPDDRERFAQHIHTEHDLQQPYELECRIITRSGEVRWIAHACQPVYGNDGVWQGQRASNHDITERKQAEEALRQNEQFVQQMTATIPGILYVYDLILERNVYSNRQMTDILGYTPDDVQAMGQDVIPTLLHPDDLPRAIEHRTVQAQAAEGAVLTFEYRMRSRDGNWRWLLSREVVFTRTDDGKPQQILGVAQDITERKETEEALRASEERFTTFMTYLPGPAFIHDENGRVVFANRTYCQHLNSPPEQIIDQPFSALLSSEWGAYFQSQDQQVLAKQDACIFEDHTEIDGQLQVFLTTKFPVQQADGSIHIGGIAFDITERKQAEEALHENRALLQGVLDHAPALIFAKDVQGRLVLANRPLERLFQVGHGEMLGKTDYDFHAPEIAAHNWAVDLEVQRTRQMVECEEYRTGGDGTLQTYLSIKFPLFDENGNLTGTCGIATDITERKRMEEALRQSEQRLHHVLRSSPVIIFTSQASGEYGATFVSDNVRRVLGYEPGEFTEQSDFWASHIHPDDAPTIFANLPQLFEHDEHEHVYRFLHRDGTYRWMYNVMRLIRDASGIPVEIIGTLEDITERKEAEEALRQSEQRLQAIFDNAAVGIGLTDKTGRSILANARGATQLGYTPEEVTQYSNLELTHPDDRAETVERMQQLVRGEIQGYRIEKRYLRKDGSIFWADISASAIYDDDGQITHFLGVVVDITERKHLEHQLQHINRLLQEQAIRDPLTGLHNRRYLDETLPRELQRAERARQPVGVIMLDIDHFKWFNDTYGHDAGDTVLRAVGAFLQHNTRGADIACRYGGEEFTLVLPGASLADTQQRAEELREGVQTLVVQHGGQALEKVTASLGVAIFRTHGTTADALVSTADQALYQAKRNGRNRVEVVGNTHDG